MEQHQNFDICHISSLFAASFNCPYRLDAGGPSNQDEVEEVEQPLIRQRPRRRSARAVVAVQEIEDDPPPSEQSIHNQHQLNGSTFPSEVP